MLYYLPDARDVVDPTFDFDRETRDPDRVRSRDDRYAHEIYRRPPYDGMLVSIALVEGAKSRYTGPERRRLYREGFRRFVRGPKRLRVMGDCGAFSYVKEHEPPYTVDQVVDFYTRTRVDHGLAVDHLILDYDQTADGALFDLVDPEARRRFGLTLELAAEFWTAARSASFEPVGVAQGWSPGSYAHAVAELQRIGYRYIALGGVVPLATNDLLAVVRAVDDVRHPETRIHLLGVTRPGSFAELARRGVASIDSTSPLRRAWMDARHNYWLGSTSYSAIRVPEATSPRIRSKIESGHLYGDRVRELEQEVLGRLGQFAHRGEGIKATLDALLRYQELHSPGVDRRAEYERTLAERPWTRCPCEICKRIGHHVILLRGAERSRRRGFHNVWHFHRELRGELARAACGDGRADRATA